MRRPATYAEKSGNKYVSPSQEIISVYNIDKVAFDSTGQPDRGYAVKASYLLDPNAGDALIQIFKDGTVLREFLFPAYKVWNIAAHFKDIVDGEIEKNTSGYDMAAWNGIS